MSKKVVGVLAALALLGAVSCSSPERDEAAPDTPEGPAAESVAPDGGADGFEGVEEEVEGELGPRRDRGAARARDRGEGSTERTTRAPRGRSRAAVLHPRSGRYVYDQNGYERYCSGATCSREELPPTQRVELSVVNRGDGRVTLESDARISSGRSSKTTTRYASRRALITRATVRFSHEQVRYSNTYRPRPPIESLRFPLRVGKSWSGSWRDNVSGTYEIEVAERDRVKVRGGAVPALRLETFTRFSGDFEGTADVVVWVDPKTRAVLASRGEVKVRSFFGAFETEFRMRLRSGPGYR